MDAPNYVQGLYTVAQRDAIFAKADKYPDASDGLQNQVPTIFPGGSIGWRQIPEGGDGTANANIAVIETTNIASKFYPVGSMLIYNDQLYRVTDQIGQGETIIPGTNVTSATVAGEALTIPGKGDNLLRNWYWIGGGSQQGGQQYPINTRGQLSYTSAAYSINGWRLAAGSAVLYSTMISLTSGTYILQPLKAFGQLVGRSLTLTAWTDTGVHTGSAVLSSSTGVQFFADAEIFGSSDPTLYGGSIVLNAVSASLVYAVKLELGGKQTLTTTAGSSIVLADPIPDYAAELERCLRDTADANDTMANLTTYWGICTTSGSTKAKTVACKGFVLEDGAHIRVRFNNRNTASQPTLNVNGTGAKSIRSSMRLAYITDQIQANSYHDLVYDKINNTWVVVGEMPELYDNAVVHTATIPITMPTGIQQTYQIATGVATILSVALVVGISGSNTDTIIGKGTLTATGDEITAQGFVDASGVGFAYVAAPNGTSATSGKIIAKYTLTTGA